VKIIAARKRVVKYNENMGMIGLRFFLSYFVYNGMERLRRTSAGSSDLCCLLKEHERLSGGYKECLDL